MIGVIAGAADRVVIEEFFELFKTPWEFYERGRTYDVVIATAAHLPALEERLVVIYGSEITNTDAALGITMSARHRGGNVSVEDSPLPIYGDWLTFGRESAGRRFLETPSGFAGVKLDLGASTIRRVGYDLFREAGFLLTEGQPLQWAHSPTLDRHIAMLRTWILEAGIPLAEIPPAPPDHSFLVCLTHDIDFTGIRNHKFDHTMWGFLGRSTLGAVRNLFRRRISFARVLKMWRAALSLPLVYLRWANDFWEPFEWYMRVEKSIPATYFIIPFKGRAGEHVAARSAPRRAVAYEVGDLSGRIASLRKEGCEVAVHGIDAWHSVQKGREERSKLETVSGAPVVGIRMHWLLRDSNTAAVLEAAGYTYDAGLGYNETIGYRNGTTQAFRPLGSCQLLELPLHIQDGALFFPRTLDLSEAEARHRCSMLIDNARRFGGVLTVLWHDRSHGPERFWGDFYADLVGTLRSTDGWFGTAAQVVAWFDHRRAIRFERVDEEGGGRTRVCYRGPEIRPPVKLRVHRPNRCGDRVQPEATTPAWVDLPWNGQTAVELGDSTEDRPDLQTRHFESIGTLQ